MIGAMEWSSAGAELPPEWKVIVSQRNRELLGKRGLGRYAWCLAAEILLSLTSEQLRELAAELREEAETDWNKFAHKWDNPESAARTLRPELIVKLTAALKKAERAGGRGRR